MPDTKISDLTTITGANTASGDQFVLNDISDSTMAASGTDKSITRAQLAAAMSAQGVAGADVLWAAAGDLLIGTGNDAGTALTVSTAAGAAPCADPNATNKLSWQYPLSVEEANRGTSGPSTLATTCDRGGATETNLAALSTGRLSVVRIFLPKGLSIANISFWSATTALSVGTNQWFALFDLNRLQLAVTADDTSTAWAANTLKTLAVTSGPYVTTRTGLYYLGVMVKATTVPTMAADGSGANNFRQSYSSTYICATADSSLTNPASCPGTFTKVSTLGSIMYAEVS